MLTNWPFFMHWWGNFVIYILHALLDVNLLILQWNQYSIHIHVLSVPLAERVEYIEIIQELTHFQYLQCNKQEWRQISISLLNLSMTSMFFSMYT